MRKFLFLIPVFAAIVYGANTQNPGRLTIQEADGSPSGSIRTLEVTNGTLTVYTSSASLTTGGGGGGSSTLEVFEGGTSSSPTASIEIGAGLDLTVSGSTASVAVDFTTVTSRSDVILLQDTLQTGSTFYVSSGTINTLNLNLTENSILFIGTDGLVTQDNDNLVYLDSSNFVGIGTNTPAARLHIKDLGPAIRIEPDAIPTGHGGSFIAHYEYLNATPELYVGYNEVTTNNGLANERNPGYSITEGNSGGNFNTTTELIRVERENEKRVAIYQGPLAMYATNQVQLWDADSSNYIGFKSSDTVSSDVTFVVPAADGTSAQVLHTDGGGVLYWDDDDTAAGGSGYDLEPATVTIQVATITAPAGYTGVTFSTPIFPTAGATFSNVSTITFSADTYALFSGTISIGGPMWDTDLDAGSSGQVLTSNGAGSSPTWQAAAGGGGDSTLAISTGTSSSFQDVISSPTAIVSFAATQFAGQKVSGTTAYIYLDGDHGDFTYSGESAALDNSVVDIANLSATGSADSSTVLRGDNTWAAVSTSTPSATPGVHFYDSDASVSTRSVAQIIGSLTDTGDGTEDFDMFINVMVAGSTTTILSIDADGLSTFKGVSRFDYSFPLGQMRIGTSNPAVIENSTNTIFAPLLLFDADTIEYSTFTSTINGLWGTPKIDVIYSMRSASSGTVEMDGQIMCITPGDSADTDTSSFASAGTATETVPGTAGYPSKLTITPTDDSCAIGDLIAVSVFRDATDGTNDTATGDAEVRSIRIYAE